MKQNIICLLIILGVGYFAWTYTHVGAEYHQWQYDLITQQSPVTKKQDIDKIINSFSTASFADLDDRYQSSTNYTSKKYKKIVRKPNFLVINGKEIFKYVVGDFRVKDFLPHDKFYHRNIKALNKGHEVYWLVDKKLLYKLLELQKALIEKGYNEKGFSIINGYRHPAYNKKVGGASMSRHLYGQALDLKIRDINNDGRANQKDKKIVLDLLEKKVIRSKGGIGRYPGTMSVHFDVRGYRARWDKQ